MLNCFLNLQIPVKVAYFGAFFNSFRQLTSPISVVYLISRGIDLNQIALLQLVLSIASVTVSYPLGIIVDKFNQKSIAYISVTLLIFYHLLYLKAPNFIYLFIAQILLSVSLILMDIGISTWLTRETRKIYKDEHKIDFYSHLENEIEAITGLMISFLFMTLSHLFQNFSNFYEMIYILTSLLLVFLLLILYFIPNNHEKDLIKTNIDNKIILFNYKQFEIFKAFKNFYVTAFLSISILIWFAYQPLFHYWQPLLASKSFNFNLGSILIKFDNINLLLGLSFCIMNISLYFFHKAVKNLSETRINFYWLGAILSVIGSILFFVICLYTNNIITAILCFSLLHGAMSCLWKITRNQLIKNYEPHHFGKVIALSVLTCRFLNIVIFYFCYKFCSTIDDIKIMYYLCAGALVGAILIFIKWNNRDKIFKNKFYITN